MADGQENDLSSEEDGDGQAEPSMEEILSSIRRIISEDDETEGTKAAGEDGADVSDEGDVADMPNEVGAADLSDEGDVADVSDGAAIQEDVDGADEDKGGDEDEDILELTRMVSEDGSVTDLTEEKEPEAEMATEAGETETLEMQDSDMPVEAAPVEMEAEQPAPVEAAPVEDDASPPASEPDGGSLLDDTAAAAASGSFGELTKAVLKEDGPGIQLGSLPDKTLEDLIKELLRPMLKEWLDQNLPSITEKLVRKEIERTARRAEEL